MDFNLPTTIIDKLAELDAFIESEIKPLEAENIQFFDHRREWARTDWENDGAPSEDWRAVLSEMERRADAAGHLRLCLPESCGGQASGNLMNAAIREHLSGKGLGLHNDLQDENSIVGNFPIVPAIARYGTKEQQVYIEGIITGKQHLSFALTEPDHGSDATWMSTRAVKDGDHWVINGAKRWNSQVGRAQANLVFARTSGKDGSGKGITAFIVPTDTPGHDIIMNHWTFNMPTDHSEVHLKDVRVPDSAILHEEGRGLEIAMMFIHENRIRQAAGSAGASRYCITEAVNYAKDRVLFGEQLATRQAIQFPLAELHAECEMIRNYIFRTAWKMDQMDPAKITDEVSICNFMANNLVCRAADFAMQVHGGLGYSRHKPFEHIYRHHRRYKITEGSEEVQKRRIAHSLFSFGKG
ncbi:Acryloyl-CoA reductase (NADH) [Marinovum algicola]|uniref:Acyl-CoA dehydrogenase n=1 Tax=Marinovum algicola TaxID=42444 RepID=A0A975WBU8_9RHOB|nr:acyl-CoA dehydrogenase family protein [Marinovum algicola]SEJ82762.1 Acyl-CoA dehydrogenase [Marinovum algicola]SLN62754.1 Acryloyl-CoA reductase (NADH) [Marinovum algicola]